METEINGIIIAGKVYEVLAEKEYKSCKGCDLFDPYPCKMNRVCTVLRCIFCFSPELTDKLNK